MDPGRDSPRGTRPDQNSQWAIVLGVSAGTGAELAFRLAADHRLNILGYHRGRRPELAAATAQRIQALGVQCQLVQQDASLPETAAAAPALLESLGAKGAVRALVHSIANASYGVLAQPRHGYEPLHARQLLRTFEGMAHSFVYWTQALHQSGALACEASLIGLSNILPDSRAHGFAAIHAAKAALETYCRYLAMELGPKGHRVHVVRFGCVQTQAIQGAFEEQWTAIVRDLGAHSHLGRIVSVEEVALLVSHLLAPEMVLLSGSVLDATSGQGQGLLDAIMNRPQFQKDTP